MNNEKSIEGKIDGKYKYFAFIAYTHWNHGADFEFANWLYKKLQEYRLPTKLVKRKKHQNAFRLFF